MASIVRDKNDLKRVLFILNGHRYTVRLGAKSMKQAEAFKVRIEALVGFKEGNCEPDGETMRWVAGLDEKMHKRLAATGLVRPRASGHTTLGAFIDAYIASRPDVKPHTLLNMEQVRAWLLKFFGESRDIRTITAGDAEDWRAFMLKGDAKGKRLGENTVRRHIGRARQLFKSAIRRGIVRDGNPFEGMAATVRADKARQFFVTREAAEKVIKACPSLDWRLAVALSRYGGLRCPSEHLSLKWSDIDWANNRIRVPSPKTAHHEGKECRIIPLFPELRPLLLEAFEQADEGAEYVIGGYRGRGINLRTHLVRIIAKAGLKPWPKPWHNMRATRQTELCEHYPMHVVCAWLGNTRGVAMEHYLQVTDAHFEKAAQNAAQHGAKSGATEGKGEGEKRENPREIPEDYAECASVPNDQYPRQDSNL